MFIGVTYYMDSTRQCSGGVVDLEGFGYPTVTLAAKKKFNSHNYLSSCSITFRSSVGFEVDFNNGWIRSNGLYLTLHSGPNSSYPELVSSPDEPPRLCCRAQACRAQAWRNYGL